MKKERDEPTNGILTNQMDFGSEEFEEFQAFLLNKSRNRSNQQKRNIELIALKLKIEDYLDSEKPDIELVGDFLKQYLQALRIQQNKFADYIGLKPSNLSKLISGERPLNYNMALILGKIFDIHPMLWINIQAKNELNKLKNENNPKYHDYSLSDLIQENENVV